MNTSLITQLLTLLQLNQTHNSSLQAPIWIPLFILFHRTLVLPKQLPQQGLSWLLFHFRPSSEGQIYNLFRVLVMAHLLLAKDTMGYLMYTY